MLTMTDPIPCPVAAAAIEALEDLEAAASKVRRLLQEATTRHGLSYRQLAAETGLSLATVQRWRLEVPPSPILRTAAARRSARPPRP